MLAWGLFSFSVGALFGVILFALAYITQLRYGNDDWKRAERLHKRTYWAAVISATLFVTGVVLAASALSPDFVAQWALAWRAMGGRLIPWIAAWVASLRASRRTPR